MRRSTYLATKGDPLENLHAQKDGTIQVEKLVAAKQIRSRLSYTVPESLGIVNIEYGNTGTLALPFDSPEKPGLHITSELGSDIAEVQKFLKSWGVHLNQHEPVATSDWYEWIDQANSFENYDKLTSLESDFGEASSFRIFTNPRENEVVIEAWFEEREWNTIESAPTELGVFTLSARPDTLIMKGRVRKLGIDDRSEPVMFKWYPKHRDANSTANISFAEPYGLHPELTISIDSKPPLPVCRLFAQLDLPKNLFIDQYQLDDLPRMSPPSELVAIWGETDLEKPEWQVSQPSMGLIHLLDSTNATYRVPLHTRYLNPTDKMGDSGVLSAPYIFWACQNKDTDRSLEYLEPHELLGISSVFPLDETSFYVLNTNPVTYQIPAIAENSEKLVESTTIWVVLLGSLCIVFAVIHTLLSKPKKLKSE